jgi:hypothetical protein
MSSSDDERKDAHLVTIVQDVIVITFAVGVRLAVDGHQLYAAMLATGEVQLSQETGHGGPAWQIEGGPAPGLVGQEGTEARKELHMHGYAQVASLSRLSCTPGQAHYSPKGWEEQAAEGKQQ